MGIIKRQSIKQLIAAYAGVGIGMINVLIIYPLSFSDAQLGVFQTMRDLALVITPFVFIGCNALTIRFFPKFRNPKNGHNGFLSMLLMILTLGLIIFYCIAFFFWDKIPILFKIKDDLFLQYLPYFFPFIALVAFSQLFTNFTSNFKRIVVPFIMNELFVKIGSSILAISFLFQWLVYDGVVLGIVVLQGIIVLSLIGYLINLKEFKLTKPNPTILQKPLVKEMKTYAGYGFLGGLGSRLATRIDTIMITPLLGSGAAGIFFISRVIGDVVDAPRRAISKISGPIIAQSLNDGDIAHVEDLYQRSSLNQLIVGIFILLGIWLSIDELFLIMPNGERFISGKYVVLVIGAANVVNMGTGINEEILVYSKYFRFKFYLILILAVLNVSTNLILIPKFGIIGAAIATFLSISLFNFLKFAILKIKLKISPFSMGTVYILGIALLSYFLIASIPLTEIHFLNLLLKSILFTLIFGGMIIYFKISNDVNDLVNGWISIALRKFKKQ